MKQMNGGSPSDAKVRSSSKINEKLYSKYFEFYFAVRLRMAEIWYPLILLLKNLWSELWLSFVSFCLSKFEFEWHEIYSNRNLNKLYEIWASRFVSWVSVSHIFFFKSKLWFLIFESLLVYSECFLWVHIIMSCCSSIDWPNLNCN